MGLELQEAFFQTNPWYQRLLYKGWIVLIIIMIQTLDLWGFTIFWVVFGNTTKSSNTLDL